MGTFKMKPITDRACYVGLITKMPVHKQDSPVECDGPGYARAEWRGNKRVYFPYAEGTWPTIVGYAIYDKPEGGLPRSLPVEIIRPVVLCTHDYAFFEPGEIVEV